LPQDLKVVFADAEDEAELQMILEEYGMGIPGSIEEQLVVKEGDQVLAGAKLVQVDGNGFYLEVIGVRPDALYRGLGKLLLGEIIKNPWRCCRYLAFEKTPQPGFHITTLARGSASAFYRRMGFEPCRMEELPEQYQEQCDICPDRQECNPVPMKYVGGKKL